MTAARKLTESPLDVQPLSLSKDGIAYGPYLQTPFGQSIGINILGSGAKACSFNCPYCDLGSTSLRLNRLKSDAPFPALDVIEQAVQAQFQKIHAAGPAIESICLSGNGEPTLHPEFPEIVKFVMAARDSWLPKKPILLFTNGANLDTRKIFEAANLLDERLVKIDAGNEKTFKAVNAPLSRSNLARVLVGSRRMKDLIVQSMFFQGAVDNTQTTDIDDWIEVIAMIRPKAVHIHGLSRKPSREGLIRCDEDTIYSIASKLERKTQIKAQVMP